MRNLVIALVLVAGVAAADTLLVETFDGSWSTNNPPTGWRIIHSDTSQGLFDWHREAAHSAPWTNHPTPFAGLRWNLYADSSPDILMSPPIDCRYHRNIVVSCSTYFAHKYSTGYTARLIYSTDGGASWNTLRDYYQQNVGPGIMESHQLAGASSAESVYVAWYHYGNLFDIYWWLLDDVLVTGDTVLEYDIRCRRIREPDLYEQPGPLSPVAAFRNDGSVAQDSIPVFCEIYDSLLNPLQSWSDTIEHLGPFSTERVKFFEPPIILTPGRYFIQFYCASDADSNRTNDTLSRWFTVSYLEELAYDNGNPAGYVNWPVGHYGYGTKFQTTFPAYLESIQVYLNAPANPAHCRYQLAFSRDDGTGNPGPFFYKTPVLLASPGTGWNSVPMVPDINRHVLVQGDPFYVFYLQVGEPPECPSLAYDDTLDQDSLHWRYLTGGAFQPYAPPGDLMIRAFVSHEPVIHAPNDARARFVSEPLYEFVPRPAGTPVPLSALVDNFGINSLSNIAVTCSIIGAGGVLRYTETQTVATMAPQEEVLVTFTPWNPLAAERCSIIVRTDLGDVTPDDIPENDDARFTCDIVPVAFTGSSPGNYAWIDSDTLGGPVFDWVDTTGAFVAISIGDEQRIYVPIGFNFPYYDTTYNNVYVCTNGWLSLGTDQGINAPNNRSLPNLDPPNRCIYPWWDNLEVGPAFGSKVWYKNDGVAPNRRFIVIWSNAHRVGTDPTDLISFEAILHENGTITFQYKDATVSDLYYDKGRAISVGLENADGTDGLNYIYSVPPLSGTRNYPGNRISDGHAIRLFKQFRDAAALDIIHPETYTFPGTIYPQVRIQNYGTVGDTITAYMRILPGNYYDTLAIEGIRPGAETTIVFTRPWLATNGSYTAACSVDMAGDATPGNDVFSKIVIVSPWVQRETIPSGPRKRKVKNSSLVYAPSTGRLYALKGGNTNEFWSYDIATGTWETLASMPLAPSGSRAKDGCDLSYDGFHGSAGRIWALKGKRTDFYYYDIAGDSWVARAPALPRGEALKVPGKGAALAFVPAIGPEGAVYCALGNLSLYFLHYDIAADTWRRTHDVPFFPLNKRSVKAGGDMVYDGDSLLYLLKGSNTTELWAYSPAVDSWLARTHNPVSLLGTRNRRVKSGGAMAFLDGTIYVLKGGNTQQFWSYTLGAGDSWIQRADLPFTLTGRRVRPKRGASMVGVDSTIFCLKGSYGYEFWEYKPAADPVGLFRDDKPEREGVMAGPGAMTTALSVWPNPGRPGIYLNYSLPEPAHVRLRIYDAAGKLIRDLLDAPVRAGRHTLRWDGRSSSGRSVAAGVYFAKLEAGNALLAHKLVIQR